MLGGRTMAIGRAIECVVVQQEEVVVRRQLGVEFDHAIAVALAGVEPRKRIFRRERAATAVRDQPRIRPVGASTINPSSHVCTP
jgi:hypothetical protein